MHRPIAAAALAALIAPSAHAGFTPGFFDGFNSPDATARDDANDPSDLGFHAMPGAPPLAVRQVEGRGGVLAASLSATTSDRDIFSSESFEPVYLVPGSPVTLGFSIRATAHTGPGGVNIPTFAFGLHDGNHTEVVDGSAGSYVNSLDDQGYHLYLNGSNTHHSSVQRDFAPNRLDVESGLTIDPFNYADGEWHDFRLVLRDEPNATFLSFDLYIDGRLHATDSFLQRGVFRFDTVHFGLIQGAMDLELDDIFVRGPVVPSPGPLALLAIGAVAARRRRA